MVDVVGITRLRRDPRRTLSAADDEHRRLDLEDNVEIIGGTDAPAQLLRADVPGSIARAA